MSHNGHMGLQALQRRRIQAQPITLLERANYLGLKNIFYSTACVLCVTVLQSGSHQVVCVAHFVHGTGS